MSVRLEADGDAGRVVLEVDPADGGRWTALRVGDLELLSGTSVPGAYPPVLTGCFPMAPYAGRVRDARLRWAGAEHPLPRTAPPHAMHGTVLDVAWDVVAAEPSRALLEVQLDERWPWPGTVRQELRLSGDRLAARLSLSAAQEMPGTLGYHPWFPRRLARGGQARLLARPGRQYERGADGTPTGVLRAPQPPPWDDCFVDLAEPPAVHWPGALTLTVSSSHRHWVLFDERPDVLCVEPQTGPPDAARLGEADVVAAGGELSLSVVLAWEADAG